MKRPLAILAIAALVAWAFVREALAWIGRKFR
jgi:hypothetical protein